MLIKAATDVVNFEFDGEEEDLAVSLVKKQVRERQNQSNIKILCQQSSLIPKILMLLSRKVFVGFKVY